MDRLTTLHTAPACFGLSRVGEPAGSVLAPECQVDVCCPRICAISSTVRETAPWLARST
jgi:hypothetical protein